MAISIVTFIIFLQFCYAIDFDFEYLEGFSNNQISVNIDLDVSNRYDVKVFLHNSSNNKITQKDIISQTLNNNDWQSSWNYVKNSFPDVKNYSIKKLSDSENYYLCVRLREVGKTSFSQVCKKLDNLSEKTYEVVEKQQEKLVLTSKIDKSEKNNIYLSKDNMILNIVTYISILFIVILFAILLFEYFRQ